jgi:hypothetical protein
MKSKRTNQTTTNGNMEIILVESSNQALAAGANVNATTAYAIQDGQIGVDSRDFEGTPATGNFITAGTTSTQVSKIKVYQGTPKSGAIHTADQWGVGDPALVESGEINASLVRSVQVKKFNPGQLSMTGVTNVPTIVSNSDYGFDTYLYSTRMDRDFGANDNVMSEVTTSPDIATVTDAKHYVLSNLIGNLNFRSKFTAVSNASAVNGNEDVLAFGVNLAGGAGQAFGTITCGTTFNIMSHSGVVTAFTADEQFVSGLAQLLNDSTFTTASTFEVINLSTLSTGNTIDSFIVAGLPYTKAAYKDTIEQVMPRVEVNLNGEFITGSPLVTSVAPNEGTGQGWKWTIADDQRARLARHTRQTRPFGEFFSEGYTYVNPKINYTSYIIDYFDYEQTMTLQRTSDKQLNILTPAVTTCPTVAAAEENIAAGNPAIPVVTSNATFVAALNASLGAWLIDAKTKYGWDYVGDGTVSTLFV